MAESVSFKAYLKRDGHEVEVRRFGVDGGAATSYMYLRSKIQAMFPSIQNDQFQVFWQDTEQDYIRVDSDEELLVALTSSNQQPLKVYVQVQNNSQGGASGTSASAGSHQTHPGVVCDGCEGAVVGFRYKCVTCPDYDLCSNCESNSLHAEHFMLRMPTPMDNFLRHPKFIRKLFSHPHKFHKRHGWSRVPPMSRGCGDSQMGAGRCPFSRRGGDAPAGPAAAFAGVTDMFDFSALMDFIESLGVAGGSDRANQSAGGVADGAERANQSAAPSDASQNPNQGPSGSQTQESSRPQSERRESSQSERRESSPAAEYLNNIGQMVAAILDPLGVDVTFDVRSKTSQQAAGAASSDSSSAPTPAPAQVSNSLYPNILVPIPPTPAPAATPIPVPAPEIPSASSQTEPTPAATIETQTEPARERRNSDDWTLLNRESPTRGEASAMEVDETRGAKPKTPPPSAAQDAPSPSAPPHNDDMSDAERQRIQDAIETFRSMGFNFNTNMLRDQLKRQNFDFLSVLEMMLNAERK